MSVVKRLSVATVATLMSLGAAASRASAQGIAIKAGISVTPETVTVGDPFHVKVGIRAPQGATITFPRTTDSASAVQSLDPVVVSASADSSAAEQYADYRVAAWDVDTQAVRLPDAVVTLNGTVRRVPLSSRVFVRSVLPADSAERVPKPPRALFAPAGLPWWVWALIALAAIAVVFLLWWWWRRRRRPEPHLIKDPYERAIADFERINGLGLVEAGERGRYVALSIEVLRDYLAARYAEANLSLTSTELTRALTSVSAVPNDRLARLLSEADLIKFARRPVSGERAREIARDARVIVDAEHQASQPVSAPPAAPPSPPKAKVAA